MTTSTMYLFTGETHVETARRERFGHSGTKVYHGPSVAVTVLAADQADAERIAAAMLSTPDDSPKDGYSDHVDKHTRHFTWSRVEPAPSGIAEAEQLRQELARTVALLDEARSDLRVSERQASDERERGEYTQQMIARVAELHVPAGSPPVCQHCQGSQGVHPAFPCRTIRALEGDA